ncbi:MAG TPA: tetratricopeptide repeat protein [Myxococcota bacterium]|nr:tetratricopeptide repeat protein [Myxococcota bacterium]HRY94752.1 tetratricopeptide repeat protein [Myxococcota bacterium]HSA20829.1 tetratricopeptide repeat protein [Myxococcota bacterium]
MRGVSVLALAACLSGCLGGGAVPPEAVRMNRLGVERLRVGDAEGARAALQVSLEYQPCFADALANLALLAYRAGQLERAEALVVQALDCRPDLVQAHNLGGAVARAQGRLEEAEARYLDALALDPGALDPRRNLVLLGLERGDLGAAEEQLRRLTALAPDDAWLQPLRAALAELRAAGPGR